MSAKKYKAYTFADPTNQLPEKIRIVAGANNLELFSQEQKETVLALPWEDVNAVTGKADSGEEMDTISFTQKSKRQTFELEIEDKMEVVRDALNKARQERLKVIARGKGGGTAGLLSRIQGGGGGDHKQMAKASMASKMSKSAKPMSKFEERKAVFEAAKKEAEEKKDLEAKKAAQDLADAMDNKGKASMPAANAIHELLLTMKIKEAAKIHEDIDAVIYKDQKAKKTNELVVTDAGEKAKLVRELRAACDVATYEGHELAPLPKFTGGKTEIRVIAFATERQTAAFKRANPGVKSHPEINIECHKSSTPLGQIVKEGAEDFVYTASLKKRYVECAYLQASFTVGERKVLTNSGFDFPGKWPKSRCMIIMEKWLNEICRKATQTYLMSM
jgi:hypothetical protein